MLTACKRSWRRCLSCCRHNMFCIVLQFVNRTQEAASSASSCLRLQLRLRLCLRLWLAQRTRSWPKQSATIALGHTHVAATCCKQHWVTWQQLVVSKSGLSAEFDSLTGTAWWVFLLSYMLLATLSSRVWVSSLRFQFGPVGSFLSLRTHWQMRFLMTSGSASVSVTAELGFSLRF